MEETEVEEISKYLTGEANNGSRQCRSSDLLLPGLIDDVSLNCLAWSSTSDYASLACVNKRYNQLIKSGDLYGLKKELGITEYWVYLFYHSRSWEAFDPIGKKWMTIPRMPCDGDFDFAGKDSLAVGSEFLVFGRLLVNCAIWKYSLISRCWVKCQPMNHPRCLFGSSSLRSIAIVAGGTDNGINALKSAELYDSSTGSWEILPDMHTPRKFCSGFFMGGKFYVIGGMSSLTVSLTCGEEYDLITKNWRKIEDMYPFVNKTAQDPPLVAVVIVDDELFAVEYWTNMVKKYDKMKNTWSVLGTLPVRTDSFNGWGLAFKACGHELLVVGGPRYPAGEGIVLHAWCPKSGISDGSLDWKVIGVKEHVGVFVDNCAVMDC